MMRTSPLWPLLEKPTYTSRSSGRDPGGLPAPLGILGVELCQGQAVSVEIEFMQLSFLGAPIGPVGREIRRNHQ